MNSTKIYNQRLDLKTVDLIYGPKEVVCMKLLKEIYEGRCFRDSFIRSIKDIIRISDVSISRYHIDTRGEIWVTFTAEIIKYTENDLIANCNIIKKIGDKVFAKTKYSNVIIINHELLKLIQEGGKIPIVVKRSAYQPLEKNISLFALPFVPSKSNGTIYIQIKPMSMGEIEKINSYVNTTKKLKEWIRNLKAKDQKKYKDFEGLFYPYKKIKKPSLLSNKHIHLLDFSTLNYEKFKSESRIIIIAPEISQFQPFVLDANMNMKENIEKKIKNEGVGWTITEEKSYIIFESLFISYIKHLIFLKNMVIEYDSFEENDPYWKALATYKQ